MRMTWDNPGEKIFEAGLDRGVLFVGTTPGVPWNGLVSVGESPTGGEPAVTYLDGEKIKNRSKRTEFAGSIEAFTYPELFSQCEGVGSLGSGLFVDNQPKVPFGLAYRTLIGNDTRGLAFGYKLHLVYNAFAGSSNKRRQTLERETTPVMYNWGFTTRPVLVAGRRSSAHFIVDSTSADPAKLVTLENLIYGTDATLSRLPTVSELVSIFQ